MFSFPVLVLSFSPFVEHTQTSPQIHTQKGPPGNDWDALQSTVKCGQAWSPALRGRRCSARSLQEPRSPRQEGLGAKSVLLWWCPGPEPPGSGSPGSRCARMRGRRALPLFVSVHSAALRGLCYTHGRARPPCGGGQSWKGQDFAANAYVSCDCLETMPLWAGPGISRDPCAHPATTLAGSSWR